MQWTNLWEKQKKTKIQAMDIIKYGWPKLQTYRYDPKYWDWQAYAHSVEPDHTPQNAASIQGPHR